jgi:hypothetical protein
VETRETLGKLRNSGNLDSEVADAVLKSIERHLDYLTEDLAVFSIYHRNLDDEDRSVIGKTLAEIQRPTCFPMGKRESPSAKLTNQKPHLPLFVSCPRFPFSSSLRLKQKSNFKFNPTSFVFLFKSKSLLCLTSEATSRVYRFARFWHHFDTFFISTKLHVQLGCGSSKP